MVRLIVFLGVTRNGSKHGFNAFFIPNCININTPAPHATFDIAQLFFDLDGESPSGVDFTYPAFHDLAFIFYSMTAAVNSAKVKNSLSKASS